MILPAQKIRQVMPVVFMRLEEPTETPYSGKYQNQEASPQAARSEK
jgi:deoxycytidine triphosphate deaminase